MKSLIDFDMAESLRTDKEIAEYLNQVIEDGDDAELARALGYVARARGMTEIAKSSGIGREALYKALRSNAKPRFDTVNKVIHALGMKISVHA